MSSLPPNSQLLKKILRPLYERIQQEIVDQSIAETVKELQKKSEYNIGTAFHRFSGKFIDPKIYNSFASFIESCKTLPNKASMEIFKYSNDVRSNLFRQARIIFSDTGSTEDESEEFFTVTMSKALDQAVKDTDDKDLKFLLKNYSIILGGNLVSGLIRNADDMSQNQIFIEYVRSLPSNILVFAIQNSNLRDQVYKNLADIIAGSPNILKILREMLSLFDYDYFDSNSLAIENKEYFARNVKFSIDLLEAAESKIDKSQFIELCSRIYICSFGDSLRCEEAHGDRYRLLDFSSREHLAQQVQGTVKFLSEFCPKNLYIGTLSMVVNTSEAGEFVREAALHQLSKGDKQAQAEAINQCKNILLNIQESTEMTDCALAYLIKEHKYNLIFDLIWDKSSSKLKPSGLRVIYCLFSGDVFDTTGEEVSNSLVAELLKSIPNFTNTLKEAFKSYSDDDDSVSKFFQVLKLQDLILLAKDSKFAKNKVFRANLGDLVNEASDAEIQYIVKYGEDSEDCQEVLVFLNTLFRSELK